MARDAVIEGMSNGVIVLDAQNRIVDLNPAAQRVIGRPASEAIGQPINVAGLGLRIADSELQDSRSKIVRLSAHGEVRIPQLARTFDLRISPLHDRRGQLTGRLVVLHDITERKRAEEEIRQHTAQLEALREVGLELTAQLDLDALLHAIVSRAVGLVGGDSGGLGLYRPGRDVLEWAMAVGPNLAPIGAILQRGEGLSGKVWETGQPLIVDDYQQWEGRAAIYESYPFRATVGVPVRWGKEFLGVLNVLAPHPHTFSQADAELLSLFATHAAIAIKNASLYESELKRSAELEALRQAGLHLTSTLELPPILEAILDHTLDVVAADDAHIFLYDGERLTFGAALWADGHQQKPFSEPRSQGLTYTVARSGERVVIPDVNNHPLFRDYPWGGSIVGLPLRIGEQVVGVMTVAFGWPHAFDGSELRVLGLLADQAAIAIENARLYQAAQQELTERERAEEALQESETRYRALIERNSDGIIVVGRDGTVCFVNPAAESLFDRQAEDLRGEPFGFPVVAGETMELDIVRKDGAKVVAEMRVVETDWEGKRAYLTSLRDITELARLREELRTMSFLDMLTGVYNRRGFFDLAHQQLRIAERAHREMLLLVADLDDLKGINDTLGHHQGDCALIEMAQVLKETFRESDVVARIGGDEFAVLAVEASEDSAEILVRRLQASLEAHNAREHRLYKLSLSFGVSHYDPEGPHSLEELMQWADERMYEHKRSK